MKRNTILVAIVGLVFLVGIVSYALNDSNKNFNTTNTPTVNEISETEQSVIVVDTNIDEQTSNEVDQNTSGSYIQYSESSLTNGNNVIFFAASWCPTCRSLDTSINSNLNSIPSNLTILKADFDSEIKLRQKYGVTYQHTLVQVDSSGNQIKKWTGSNDLNAILDQLI